MFPHELGILLEDTSKWHVCRLGGHVNRHSNNSSLVGKLRYLSHRLDNFWGIYHINVLFIKNLMLTKLVCFMLYVCVCLTV